MPTATPAPDAQVISLPAKGLVLAAIKARAARDDEPLGRSAAAIIADAIAQPGDVLAAASTEDLLYALQRKMQPGIAAADYDAAVERATAAEQRAEAAEARMDAIRQAMGS